MPSGKDFQIPGTNFAITKNMQRNHRNYPSLIKEIFGFRYAEKSSKLVQFDKNIFLTSIKIRSYTRKKTTNQYEVHLNQTPRLKCKSTKHHKKHLNFIESLTTEDGFFMFSKKKNEKNFTFSIIVSWGI